MINPYAVASPASEHHGGANENRVHWRRPVTHVHAVAIGVGVAMICPVYLSFSWYASLGFVWAANNAYLMWAFVVPGLVAIGMGWLAASVIPAIRYRAILNYPMLLPFVVLTALFSTMFTLLGFGYLNQTFQLGPYRLTMLSVFHSVIVGTAVFLHLFLRPVRRDSLGEMCREPSV
ncbi:hypothetical protein LOC71_00290 [Rhodopirellula sp. JC740]|uniref:Uncharacterized protein n=1 Tax=Rhodopirellula halodulae TaxID=2894198 RepID=A0ABS8NAV1_9BACT|nr:hypothetical protein [Rhodopirellula sp. JC740]MCC9640695.1 hypothetical protein [Rhodopirellula sp. JC740]